MRARIQKWGNSLAVRIPKPIAAGCGLDADSDVEINVVRGKMILAPAARRYSLNELLGAVTEDNLHDECNTGRRRGKEIW